MNVVILLLMHFITGIIIIASGLLLLKKHSKFPDTSIGYHMQFAMKNEKVWTFANKITGIICILSGLLLFLIVPIVLAYMKMGRIALLISYFSLMILFLLVLFVFPVVLCKQKELN